MKQRRIECTSFRKPKDSKKTANYREPTPRAQPGSKEEKFAIYTFFFITSFLLYLTIFFVCKVSNVEPGHAMVISMCTMLLLYVIIIAFFYAKQLMNPKRKCIICHVLGNENKC